MERRKKENTDLKTKRQTRYLETKRQTRRAANLAKCKAEQNILQM